MLKIRLVLILLLHVLILTNIRFTAWPEMFSYPYFLNNNFKLYQDIALPYEPGLPMLLASIYKLAGYNLLVLQVLTWGLILLSDILIFLISKKVIGKKLISLLPVILFVLLQPFMDGNNLWFDLATVPVILLSIVSYLYTIGFKKYFLMGLFLGIAFFIKQQVGISIALIGLYFFITKSISNKLFPLTLGFLVPATGVILYIISNNLIEDYIFWTITVPIYWYPKFPGYTHWLSIKELGIILLAFGSIIISFAGKVKLKKEEHILFLLLFLGAFLSAFPRFEFFRMQPALALITVLFTLAIPKSRLRFVILLLPILVTFMVLSKMTLSEQARTPRFYGKDDLKLAQIIQDSPQSKIYLLGVSSLQYVLASKTTSKPWVDNYVWYMDIPGMQEKVLEGFEDFPPEVIYRKIPSLGNWYDLGVYQPQKIVDYIYINYDKTNIINSEIEVWKRKN